MISEKIIDDLKNSYMNNKGISYETLEFFIHIYNNQYWSEFKYE